MGALISIVLSFLHNVPTPGLYAMGLVPGFGPGFDSMIPRLLVQTELGWTFGWLLSAFHIMYRPDLLPVKSRCTRHTGHRIQTAASALSVSSGGGPEETFYPGLVRDGWQTSLFSTGIRYALVQERAHVDSD